MACRWKDRHNGVWGFTPPSFCSFVLTSAKARWKAGPQYPVVVSVVVVISSLNSWPLSCESVFNAITDLVQLQRNRWRRGQWWITFEGMSERERGEMDKLWKKQWENEKKSVCLCDWVYCNVSGPLCLCVCVLTCLKFALKSEVFVKCPCIETHFNLLT